MSGLDSAVAEVARLRYLAARNRAALTAERDAFNRAHAPLIDAAQAVEAELLAAETALKGAAVALYLQTGNAHPAPGVQIKVASILKYTIADALEWARRTGLCLIPETLDEKALARIAKVQALPFLQILPEPRATLATDLDAALALAAKVQVTTDSPPAPAEPF